MGLLARMVESRGVAEDYARWEKASGMGAKTKSGVVINDQTALTISTVFACHRTISEDCAKLPLKLFRRGSDGGRQEASERSLYRVLHSIANPEMTAMECRETLMGHVLARGNAWGWPERNGAGEVMALWPLNPTRMQVLRVIATGTLWYAYTLPSGEVRKLRHDQVMHLRGLAFDGVMGYSPLTLARESMGLAAAIDRHAASFFGNGAWPGVVLIHPGELGEEGLTNLRNSWNEAHQGLERGHAVAVLEEDMKLETLGFNAAEAQLIEAGVFRIGDLCRWWRMPPHKVGELSRATFSNIEHQSLEYVGDTLQPWLTRFEQRAGLSLLTSLDRERGYYCEHNVAAILRADAAARSAYYKAMREMGVFSVDDIRALENENPIGGPEGNERVRPANMVPLGTPAPSPATPAATRDAFAPLIAGAWRRGLRRLAEAGEAADRREAAAEYAMTQLEPVVEAWRAVGGRPTDLATQVSRWWEAGAVNVEAAVAIATEVTLGG